MSQYSMCGKSVKMDDGTCARDAIYYAKCGLLPGHSGHCIAEATLADYQHHFDGFGLDDWRIDRNTGQMVTGKIVSVEVSESLLEGEPLFET